MQLGIALWGCPIEAFFLAPDPIESEAFLFRQFEPFGVFAQKCFVCAQAFLASFDLSAGRAIHAFGDIVQVSRYACEVVGNAGEDQ